VARHADLLAAGFSAPAYRHPETGAEVAPAWLPEALLDEVARPLVPGGAVGSGARPGAALDDHAFSFEAATRLAERHDQVVARFAGALAGEGLSATTVRRHADNALLLGYFLAGQGVPLAALHELDLRLFLFDWYAREADAGVTRARALPVSLARFLDWLAAAEGIDSPAGRELLADRRPFDETWLRLVDGEWDEDIAAWQQLRFDEMELRLLTPALELAGVGVWGPLMGPDEAGLHRELGRRWLLWRDELVAAGTTDLPALGSALAERQRAWETSPHPALDGRTPAEAIAAERGE
jgi:hypothetical protein